MSRAQEKYAQWLQDEHIDDATKKELESIAQDPKEIEDRFYKDLEFGTGGLRGVTGTGTNRMNRYTVGLVTQGLAEYILGDANRAADDGPSVAIAYDCRHFSAEFALEAGLVLAANGVKAFIFESLRPTPELSFAVRRLRASAGVVVTASHNPPEYNGYKVYGPDGCQLVPDYAAQLIQRIQGISSLGQIASISKSEAEARGLLRRIGEDLDGPYVQAVLSVSPNPQLRHSAAADLKVVYTPLHGAGNHTVRRVLREAGFAQLRVVKEQEQPDPQFSTVSSPNPEERQAFTIAIEQARAIAADLIIGTDPDSDRMGAVVRDGAGDYRILSGNQSGALMVHYLLHSLHAQGKLPANGVVIKTIVTSELGAAIAEKYGLEVLNTLTGFKYIGEKMTEFEAKGDKQFLFGYEESYGYLAGTYCRDKDAVVASMLICEAAAYYKQQGQSLYDVLQELYRTFGFHLEHLESRTMKGLDGLQRIQAIMEQWRGNPPKAIGGADVVRSLDYLQGIDGLPRENVMKFMLSDGSWFCLRPSGTEPKIKIYFSVRDETEDGARVRLNRLTTAVLSSME